MGDIWGYSFDPPLWVISLLSFFLRLGRLFVQPIWQQKSLIRHNGHLPQVFGVKINIKQTTSSQKIYYLDFHFSFVISLGWWFISIFTFKHLFSKGGLTCWVHHLPKTFGETSHHSGNVSPPSMLTNRCPTWHHVFQVSEIHFLRQIISVKEIGWRKWFV